MAAQLTYSGDGGNGLVISQEDRTLGGVGLPAITTRMVRQPPAPQQPGK
ncbi:MAG: hypothetical protein QM775_11200 [Pirellulales bacterium]